jgi:hypothetical protein
VIIDYVYGDATKFDFPKEPIVVFLFNPMKLPALRRFVNNLCKSYTQSPRNIFIIFVNPSADAVEMFVATGIFKTSSSFSDLASRVALWLLSNYELVTLETPSLETPSDATGTDDTHVPSGRPA